MVELVKIQPSRPLSSVDERYALLARLSRIGTACGADVLAFAFTRGGFRFGARGSHTQVSRVIVGVRRGTAHHAARCGHPLRLEVADRRVVEDVAVAVLACHRPEGDVDPLVSPWTSHRDLMGLRQAPFFDAERVRRLVSPRAIHAACGGAPLPRGWPPPSGTHADLGTLLRVAGAVAGLLPGDRRTFPIFVHLARLSGHPIADIAAALALTPRRVRQMLARAPDLLAQAGAHMLDPRLSDVP